MQRDPNIHRTIHNLLPGTPEWHTFRVDHYGASEAPAMIGCSPYKTRSELIRERATGIKPDVDAFTQKRFDDGHKYEALARPLAEAIIGMDLYPVTASLGKMSASFDGLSMCETVVWEHKTLNDQIRACETAADLPLVYRVQMEQQVGIVSAEKALFSATRWDDAGNLLEEKHLWYTPDLALRAQIITGWEQFEVDVANYAPQEIIEPAKAAPLADLPVVTVQVRGELAMCNLDAVTPLFDKFLAEAKIELITDDDFALAAEQAKTGRTAAKQCKLTAKAVVDQMQSIAAVTRTLEDYATKFDAMALIQEKAVKEQKDARRAAAKLERDRAYADYIATLEAGIAPIRLVLSDAGKPQFTEAMKNQRTLSSLYNKLDTELSRAKIAASQAAADISAKLSWFNANVGEHRGLFADLQQIIGKAAEDFQLVVNTRIEKHQAEQAAKAEAMRAQIAAQERAKAEAAAAEKLAAERKADADRAAAEHAERDRAAAESKRQMEERPAQITANRQTAALAEQGHLTDLADAQSPAEELALVKALPDGAELSPAATELYSREGEDNFARAHIPPSLKLGDINERLGFTMTADFLATLGFVHTKTDKPGKLYHEVDFKSMCAALCRHITAVQAKHAA